MPPLTEKNKTIIIKLAYAFLLENPIGLDIKDLTHKITSVVGMKSLALTRSRISKVLNSAKTSGNIKMFKITKNIYQLNK